MAPPLSKLPEDGMVDWNSMPVSSLATEPLASPVPPSENRNNCVSTSVPPTVEAENAPLTHRRYRSSSPPSAMVPLMVTSGPAPSGVSAEAGRSPASPASS